MGSSVTKIRRLMAWRCNVCQVLFPRMSVNLDGGGMQWGCSPRLILDASDVSESRVNEEILERKQSVI